MTLTTIRNLIPHSIIRLLRQNIFVRRKFRKELRRKTIALYAEVTTYCNARCVMCSWPEKYIDQGMQTTHMPQKIIDHLLDSVQKIAGRGYHISFFAIGLGEPLLYPELVDLFCKLKAIAPGIRIVLTTNGIPLKESTFTELVKAGIDEITISLNADSREGYQTVMGIDKYETVLKNIHSALRYKKERNLISPKISIQFLDSDHLKKSFFGIVKSWLPYLTGTDKVFFHEIVSAGGSCSLGKKSKVMENTKTRFPGHEPWNLISVQSDGSTYPCSPPYFWKEKKDDLYLGNILEKDLIDLFFENCHIQKVRDAMLRNDYSRLPTCTGCDNPILAPNPFLKDKATSKWY